MATVYLVDDDAGMRRSLTRLIRAVGFTVRPSASAHEFLAIGAPDRPGCLLLDVKLPDINGLDLQEELVRKRLGLPTIFITGHGDVPMSVRAMKGGAVEFLLKPFDQDVLLQAIHEAIAKDNQQRSSDLEREQLSKRLESLTPRERQVFDLVIKGLLNKQIAGELGAAEQTIKVHRARVMQKLQVTSVAELVQIAFRCRVHAGR